MFITVELLTSKVACNSQVELFEKMFPNGVEATEEVCASVAQLFHFNWAASYLLTPVHWERYAAERKPIDDAYRTQRKSIDDAVSSSAYFDDAYREAIKPINDAYLVKRARLFGRISST